METRCCEQSDQHLPRHLSPSRAPVLLTGQGALRKARRAPSQPIRSTPSSEEQCQPLQTWATSQESKAPAVSYLLSGPIHLGGQAVEELGQPVRGWLVAFQEVRYALQLVFLVDAYAKVFVEHLAFLPEQLCDLRGELFWSAIGRGEPRGGIREEVFDELFDVDPWLQLELPHDSKSADRQLVEHLPRQIDMLDKVQLRAKLDERIPLLGHAHEHVLLDRVQQLGVLVDVNVRQQRSDAVVPAVGLPKRGRPLGHGELCRVLPQLLRNLRRTGRSLRSAVGVPILVAVTVDVIANPREIKGPRLAIAAA
eukprot:scaffold5763_cov249-Pinguiococcus_pyrenoidosus.AAC.2